MKVKKLIEKVVVVASVMMISGMFMTNTKVVMAAETMQEQEVYTIEAGSGNEAIAELENAKESYTQNIEINCDKEGVVQEVMLYDRNRLLDFGCYTYKDYIYMCGRKRYQYTSKKLNIFYSVDTNQEVLIDQFMEQTAPALVGESDYETICNVHDYICNWVTYDYDTMEGKSANYSLYSAIFQHKTVCSGYAKFFQKFMEVMNIESYIVCSREQNHAWNIVKLDGTWYHVDCTWDDSNDVISRKYFLKGSNGLVNTPAWKYKNIGNIVL